MPATARSRGVDSSPSIRPGVRPVHRVAGRTGASAAVRRGQGGGAVRAASPSSAAQRRCVRSGFRSVRHGGGRRQARAGWRRPGAYSESDATSINVGAKEDGANSWRAPARNATPAPCGGGLSARSRCAPGRRRLPALVAVPARLPERGGPAPESGFGDISILPRGQLRNSLHPGVRSRAGQAWWPRCTRRGAGCTEKGRPVGDAPWCCRPC